MPQKASISKDSFWQGSKKTFKPGSEEQAVSHPHLSPWNYANSPVGSVPDKTQECMASPEGREDHPHYLRSVPWYLWLGECQKLVCISALLLITPLLISLAVGSPLHWDFSEIIPPTCKSHAGIDHVDFCLSLGPHPWLHREDNSLSDGKGFWDKPSFNDLSRDIETFLVWL